MAPTIAQQVAAILAGQQAPVTAGFQRAQAQAGRQAAQVNAARMALVRQLQAGVGPAGHVYDQAVAQQQALAREAGAQLAAASPDAGIQHDLALINAPQGQRAGVAAANRADFAGQGAVLHTNQGAIPGAGLVAQRAGVESYLAGLPTVAALSGEQTLRGLEHQQSLTRDQYLNELARIQGQAPALIQNAQATAASNAAKAQAAAAENAYRNAQLTQGQERINQGARRTTLQDQRARDAAAAKDAAKAGKSRDTAIRNRRKGRTTAINKVRGVKTASSETKTVTDALGTTTSTVKTRRPYGAVFNEALNLPEVQAMKTAYGFSDQQVRELVRGALAAKGVVPPKAKPKKSPIPGYLGF